MSEEILWARVGKYAVGYLTTSIKQGKNKKEPEGYRELEFDEVPDSIRSVSERYEWHHFALMKETFIAAPNKLARLKVAKCIIDNGVPAEVPERKFSRSRSRSLGTPGKIFSRSPRRSVPRHRRQFPTASPGRARGSPHYRSSPSTARQRHNGSRGHVAEAKRHKRSCSRKLSRSPSMVPAKRKGSRGHAEQESFRRNDERNMAADERLTKDLHPRKPLRQSKKPQVLSDYVEQAVSDIFDSETIYQEAELVRRISTQLEKHIRDTCAHANAMAWDIVVSDFVKSVKRKYAANWGSAPWFIDLNLLPALSFAATEIVTATRHQPGTKPGRSPSSDQLARAVGGLYEEWRNTIPCYRAIWDVVNKLFDDERVQVLVGTALIDFYDASVDKALLLAENSLNRVETFLEEWVSNSMSSVSEGLKQANFVMNKKLALDLYQNLVAPAGDDDPTSCIPLEFIRVIGRPPNNWDTLAKFSEVLFDGLQGFIVPVGNVAKRAERSSAEANAIPRAERAVPLVSPPRMVPPSMVRPTAVDEYLKESNGVRNGRGCSRQPGRLQQAANEDPHSALVRSSRRAEEEAAELEEMDSGSDVSGQDAPDGHPDCSQAEDCCGVPSDRLVRHVMEGVPCDIYCHSCWSSFLKGGRCPDNLHCEYLQAELENEESGEEA